MSVEPRPIVLWGATGQALVVHEFARDVGYDIRALVDNDPAVESPLAGLPVLHGRAGLESWLDAGNAGDLGMVVTIGGHRGRDRIEIATLLGALGVEAVDAVHPAAYLAHDATWGIGLQAMAGAVVATHAQLGSQCLINTGATVDHECILGDGVHIGPGAHLAGLVVVGHHAFVGAGATVLPRVTIGEDAIVGAGAVVTKDVAAGDTVIGNPARAAPQRPST